ncbi:MAG TPA: endonuclease/exonuclease/phosphatase family protein [Gaiellaceae bacterium]|nr:endonuclease/exonuclease/phosphatase family protein [Gaiellaceae bacterium]
MKKLLVTALAVLVIVPAAATASDDKSKSGVRFATFNLSLNRSAAGLLVEHLSNPGVDDVFRRQARNNAEVIQRVRPDVLLINEFDFAPQAVELFRRNFLEVSQNGAKPIHYRYTYIAPSNTGVATGFDLNNNGSIVTTPGAFGYGDDAFGFGAFPGQFGMVVYSKYPILREKVRTFQFFRWKDMPGALLPDDAATPAPMDWYNADELNVFRLSSKSHWDIPIRIRGKTVHFLASHPTPPVFDGAEDRNGKRNHDEIRFWADYISGGSRAAYIYDDGGVRGGLEPGSRFVVAGDQNSDPLDGDSVPGAIQQLLNHPLVNTSKIPDSAGAVEAAALQGGANATHKSDPRFDTADFADSAPGNLRADYVLPSKNIKIADSAVFWPVQSDPLFRLTGVFNSAAWGPVGGFPTSDHRLVWVDTRLGGGHDDDDDDD